MKKILSLLLTAALACAGPAPFAQADAPVQQEIYVSVNGSDDADGTKDAPFQTITRAQQAVRERNRDMTGDIVVYLREGVYRQEDTLVFTEEDGGTNGYYVRYAAYPGEKAEISGGRQVTGWSGYQKNIWVADVHGVEYVRQLYVNNRSARRAQSEYKIDAVELFDIPGNEYPYDGLVATDKKYAQYQNQSDIQLHFARGWKSYLLNVEEIKEGSGGSRFIMQQPAFRAAEDDNSHHNLDSGHNFWLENAMEELDIPGEFYYNRSEQKLYYMPRADEDMRTANVELAVLDKLIDIKGANSNQKVKNLAFDSLTLAHATWLRAARVGQVNDQAQWMTPDASDIPVEPGYAMVPSNISLDRAEKISFTNCEIRDMGAVGIGLYQGVENCTFEGNVFCDIADSAMTVGTADQVYPDKVYQGYNLAGGKPPTASSFDPLYPPIKALDGNANTGWSPSGVGPHWWQVDLGEAYEIDRVEIDARLGYDQQDSRRSFEVIGSNDPEFKSYKILCAQGPQPYPHEGTAVLKVANSEKFRYVRIRKNSTDYLYLADVRVINESMDYAPINDICKFNRIANNYITRIGVVNYGAPGIQAYYVQGLDVSHNEIYDVPYSGVCIGWGWSNYPDLTTCRDNRVNYNYIDKVMQVQFDGGATYMLGSQPNSVQIGNYIGNQPNNLSGMYLDSGSANFSFRDNIVENTPVSFFSAVVSSDNSWVNNFASSSRTMYNSSDNVHVENTQIFIPGDYPLKALEIMKKAGIEDRYQGIQKKAGDNFWPFAKEYVADNARKEVVYGLMSDANFVIYYLSSYVQSAQEWLKIAEVGSELGMYPQEAVDRFAAAVESARLLAQKSPVDRFEILAGQEKLMDALAELKSSRVTYPVQELISMAQEELTSTQIGAGLGMSVQADYDRLKNAAADAAENSGDAVIKQYLEKSLLAFRKNKVNLDVSGITLSGQTGMAEIDKENSVITVNVKHAADLSAVKPVLSFNSQARISPDPNVAQDFTKDVAYTLTTQDGSASRTWTIRTVKPEAMNRDGTYSLKEAIADKDGWNNFATYNCSNYTRQLYGDMEFEFDMSIEARENDWPSLVVRSQDPDKDFSAQDNDSYVFVFTPGNIEFHRFNKGVRTQFYGPVEGVTTIFGGSIQTEAFRFGEKNKMKLTTRNENGGVHIVLTINGETVIDFVDSYEGALTSPGYIGTVSPNAPVILSAE